MIYGIDIGGSKIELAAFGDDLDQVERWRIATPKSSYGDFIETIGALIRQADKRFGDTAVIGLGIPGLVEENGGLLAANLPSTNGRRVAADIANHVGRGVTWEKDCRCFALSEAVGGAGSGFPVVFGAILGTGAAGGLVVNGRLVRGRQGIAGEYGHIQLPATLVERYELPLLRCGCGLTACLETYIAGPGLMRLAARFGIEAPDVPALARMWQANDLAALPVRDCFIDLLGATFATVTMMVDPHVIVIGGSLSLIEDVRQRLPRAIERHLFPGFRAPAVLPARFVDASGARGAAILAQQTTP